MSWIVTVHSTGGSMGEAVDSLFTVRVTDKNEALSLVNDLNKVAAEREYEEIWATCGPITHDLTEITLGNPDMKSAFKKALDKRFD